MSLPVRLEIGGRVYHIQYSANALRRLEKELGRSTNAIGLLLVSGRGGFAELQAILWAGLEGARLKDPKGRPTPYGIDEVGDLIDEAGGVHEVWAEGGVLATAVLEAWQAAFPQRVREGAPTHPQPAAAVN